MGLNSHIAVHPVTAHYLQCCTSSQTTTLEVGCGPGQHRRAVRGRYVGLDVTDETYGPGTPRLPDVLGQARALPFPHSQFDVVLFSNVFHYFEEAGLVLQEAHRVLKPSGRLLIFDYTQRVLRRLRRDYALTGQQAMAHVRRAAEWPSLVRAAGFRDVRVDLKSLSLKWRLLRHALSAQACQRIIDRLEAGIVIQGVRADP